MFDLVDVLRVPRRSWLARRYRYGDGKRCILVTLRVAESHSQTEMGEGCAAFEAKVEILPLHAVFVRVAFSYHDVAGAGASGGYEDN